MADLKTIFVKILVVVGIVIILVAIVFPLLIGIMFTPKIRLVTENNVIGQIESKIAAASLKESSTPEGS